MTCKVCFDTKWLCQNCFIWILDLLGFLKSHYRSSASLLPVTSSLWLLQVTRAHAAAASATVPDRRQPRSGSWSVSRPEARGATRSICQHVGLKPSPGLHIHSHCCCFPGKQNQWDDAIWSLGRQLYHHVVDEWMSTEHVSWKLHFLHGISFPYIVSITPCHW